MKPSYVKIKEDLEKLIERGELKTGERLPSEKIMAKQFSVSRETFRSAIKLLQQEGRVVIKHGVGTFIVNPLPQIPNSLEKLGSVTNMIKSAGLTEGEQRESIQVENCNEEWARQLQVEHGTPVIVHKRIRTANGEPVVFSLNILRKEQVNESILEKDTIGSLFNYLENECSLTISKADSELVVPLHTDSNSQKLLIHPETTVLLMKQLHYDQNNVPILYSYDYFRNDVFKFSIRRMR
ncbi:GntR family transcriptional regulator [Aquibacillus rhizosphaerae]|uniref:GntR family transcriptional regulator n=1 Tax=Aquibacillus rhizosphaerae TaxID=3051431 RepID=A0ABT7LAT6_9BACI|nr:GntR family transcriptional regulator [Aquibacillus sp. LR5S19]MDL4842524.1 GntR family transcriptional regulator [Aquibacillus sp. LR5S19]